MKGYRTMAVNVLTIISLCLGVILAGDVRDIDPRLLAAALMASTVVNMLLRTITTTPFGGRGDTRA
jgi:hypothetical protein